MATNVNPRNDLDQAFQKATEAATMLATDCERALGVLRTFRDNFSLIDAKCRERDACRANPSAASFTRSMELEKELKALLAYQDNVSEGIVCVGLAMLMTGCGLKPSGMAS